MLTTASPTGERQLLITRAFAAPPEAVFQAHCDADLIRQWVLGPPGWQMTTCIHHAAPGGAIELAWVHPTEGGFRMTGRFLEVTPPTRIVHIEQMHLPDPAPETLVETTFTTTPTGTTLTMLMTFADAATRDAMLANNMAAGMESSYARLDDLL